MAWKIFRNTGKEQVFSCVSILYSSESIVLFSNSISFWQRSPPGDHEGLEKGMSKAFTVQLSVGTFFKLNSCFDSVSELGNGSSKR